MNGNIQSFNRIDTITDKNQFYFFIPDSFSTLSKTTFSLSASLCCRSLTVESRLEQTNLFFNHVERRSTVIPSV